MVSREARIAPKSEHDYRLLFVTFYLLGFRFLVMQRMEIPLIDGVLAEVEKSPRKKDIVASSAVELIHMVDRSHSLQVSLGYGRETQKLHVGSQQQQQVQFPERSNSHD